MKKVLVIGLGEVGFPLYEIIKESNKFEVYGYDIDIKKRQKLNQPWTLPKEFDVIHICFPCTDNVQFCETVLKYMLDYRTRLLVINSTVTPYTTSTIAKYEDCLIVHSPIRGMHKTMKRDIKRYTKFIGPTSKEAGLAAKDHFEAIGLKVRVLGKAVDTELGKLVETCYTALQIAAWQEFHRIALAFNADIDNVAELTDDIEARKYVQIGPVWFPDVIRGHCLIPNLELLTNSFDSKLLKQVIESNERREWELEKYGKKIEVGLRS